MKSISLAGILLVVLGSVVLFNQGITYTHRGRALDVGPIHAAKETQEQVSLPPILGGLVLVGGVTLLGLARDKGIAGVLDLGREGDKAATADCSIIEGVVGSQLTLRTIKLSECNSDHEGQR